MSMTIHLCTHKYLHTHTHIYTYIKSHPIKYSHQMDDSVWKPWGISQPWNAPRLRRLGSCLQLRSSPTISWKKHGMDPVLKRVPRGLNGRATCRVFSGTLIQNILRMAYKSFGHWHLIPREEGFPVAGISSKRPGHRHSVLPSQIVEWIAGLKPRRSELDGLVMSKRNVGLVC